ncbi:MAG TPA: heme ABC exporter ATP-binding protein CcmA [Candidatus Udaeobacter sp.]|nr:heme ABC exporter ATP-binding protein CcmA [Candidatus Udaeobacter sp.]
MITAQNLTKNYRRNAVLRGMSFVANAGEITLVVGPNGAGKTTTIKVLAGLVRPNEGTARINSFDVVRDRINAQRMLSYLPQQPNFHPRLRCGEIIQFYARLRGVALSRCEAMLDQTGLREFERMQIGELSGGTRQRLGLALLLLPDAPVLLLDEPGLSLDPTWRKRLQETLRFEAARGKAVLVTTHLVAEWNDVAHRCLLCCDGKIDRELDPRDLPQNFDEMKRPDPALIYEPHVSVFH